jgi:hypothetical protein
MECLEKDEMPVLAPTEEGGDWVEEGSAGLGGAGFTMGSYNMNINYTMAS